MSHPIKELLIGLGYKLIDSGEYWRCSAIYRGGTSPTSLAINKKTGRFRDFSANLSGDAEKLVKLVTGKVVDFSSYQPVEEQVKEKVVKIFPREYLKTLLPQFEFFKNRGISEATLKTFEAGMAHGDKMNRRICFPIYDRHNRIIGFAGRWFKETPLGNTPKWKLLGYKADWLFPVHLNETIIRDKRELIIVESVGDLLALWEAGIKHTLCIFGVSLSSKQLSYIIGLDPKKIIIATNNDEGGMEGQKGAARIQTKLKSQFDLAEILTCFPTKKDFGIMNKQEVLSWYAKIPNKS